MEIAVMVARIYLPARSATQSGTGRTIEWLLEFERTEPRDVDPLMGWVGSGDTNGQVKLSFPTREEAVAYAESNGIAYMVIEPALRRVQKKLYSDNFKFGRLDRWTH
jgi:ETC complex I subunit conserved region